MPGTATEYVWFESQAQQGNFSNLYIKSLYNGDGQKTSFGATKT